MNHEDIKNVLKLARETYGNKNQILVCIEELNELACVLAKYPRYDDENVAVKELSDKALDEFADVLIILDHVQNIMKLSDAEIDDRVCKKVSRLSRWLKSSNSMQTTIDDRAVEKTKCVTCENWSNPEYGKCKTCMSTESVEGIKPFYTPRKD